VTIGNVFEPYLHLTHDFGMLHQRLLAGHSWVEACWMAMPVTSWQGVVLGDPLYRRSNTSAAPARCRGGQRLPRPARRHARMAERSAERRKQLDQAAERMRSGLLAEAVGLDFLNKG
jgi:hypothetical protein